MTAAPAQHDAQSRVVLVTVSLVHLRFFKGNQKVPLPPISHFVACA